MKKMILLSFLILLMAGVGYGQDKVGVPIWNIGDKWKLIEDVTIIVANADESSYAVKYLTGSGESILIFEKSSLNRLYIMDKDKRIPYEGRNKRLFNFPAGTTMSSHPKAVNVSRYVYSFMASLLINLSFQLLPISNGKLKSLLFLPSYGTRLSLSIA